MTTKEQADYYDTSMELSRENIQLKHKVLELEKQIEHWKNMCILTLAEHSRMEVLLAQVNEE